MRAGYIFVGISLIASMAGLFFVYLYSKSTVDSFQDSTKWHSLIQEEGAVQAYKFFSKDVALETPSIQHNKAHEFGGALFDVVGIEGLVVCDTQFSYGCFHEFLGTAIVEMGLSVVPQLNAVCIEKLGNDAHFCHHGIGHGLQSYGGYSARDLRFALVECEKLPGNDPIGGCYGGIYMEYNLRTMLAGDAEVRISDDVFDACRDIPETAQEACHFWSPQWWIQSMERSHTLEERYAIAGSYCRDISSNNNLTKTCFRGLGNVVPNDTNYDFARSVHMCEHAANENSQYLTLCLAGAASIFQEARHIDNARALCDSVAFVDTQLCLEYAGIRS